LLGGNYENRKEKKGKNVKKQKREEGKGKN
jgi:hypothetical protein